MNEPRFQYSIFPAGDRGEQYVVRADNMAEFKILLQELKDHIAGRISAGAQPVVSQPAPIAPQAQVADPNFGANRVPCKACGSDTEYREFTSKAGNFVKGYFCKANRDHKPFFVK